MKFVSYAALAVLALWDLPPLWRAGKKKELAVWFILAIFAGGLLWLHFWSDISWTLADLVIKGG